MIEERDASGGQLGTLQVRYELADNVRLRMDRANGSGGVVSSYYVTDGLGSTVALTDAVTGALTDGYSYDAWGVPTHVAGSTANLFLFNVQQWDEGWTGTGLDKKVTCVKMPFYTYNISCIGCRMESVIDFLSARKINSFVTQQGKFIVITCEEGFSREYSRLASQTISQDLESDCISFINWDNSLLSYDLLSNGELIDSYISNPDDSGQVIPPPPPYGGAPELLCSIFGVIGLESEVSSALRWYKYAGLKKDDIDEFINFENSEMRVHDYFQDEMARHTRLVTLLNLPSFTTSFLYKDLLNEYPQDESLDVNMMIRVSS